LKVKLRIESGFVVKSAFSDTASSCDPSACGDVLLTGACSSTVHTSLAQRSHNKSCTAVMPVLYEMEDSCLIWVLGANAMPGCHVSAYFKADCHLHIHGQLASLLSQKSCAVNDSPIHPIPDQCSSIFSQTRAAEARSLTADRTLGPAQLMPEDVQSKPNTP